MNKTSTQVELIKAIMERHNLKNATDLGDFFEKSIGEVGKNRQSKYNKGSRLINNPTNKDLLILAGLFGVPYEKLKNADPSLIDRSITNNNTVNVGGNMTGSGNMRNNNQSNSSGELPAQDFVKLSAEERKDYLEYLKLIKK